MRCVQPFLPLHSLSRVCARASRTASAKTRAHLTNRLIFWRQMSRTGKRCLIERFACVRCVDMSLGLGRNNDDRTCS